MLQIYSKRIVKTNQGKNMKAWRYSNIVLRLEKMKFTNTLKNNVQLGDEINGTKGTKQLQNNKSSVSL